MMAKSHWLWLLVVSMLALSACGGAGANLVWVEPFDNGDAWALSSDAVADVTVESGQLLVHVFEPGQVAWATAEGKVYRDFSLSVDATQVAGPDNNEYGVLARMDGDTAFYAFSVSGDGYVRAARYDEEDGWTVLGSDWVLNEAVHQGAATNLLELEAQGPTYRFFVNGQEVLAVEDDTRLKGPVGLYAGAFDEGDVLIAFDNLDIKPLE